MKIKTFLFSLFAMFVTIVFSLPVMASASASADYKQRIMDEISSLVEDADSAFQLPVPSSGRLQKSTIFFTISNLCIGFVQEGGRLPESVIENAVSIYESQLRGAPIDMRKVNKWGYSCLSQLEAGLMRSGHTKAEAQFFLEAITREVIRQFKAQLPK